MNGLCSRGPPTSSQAHLIPRFAKTDWREPKNDDDDDDRSLVKLYPRPASFMSAFNSFAGCNVVVCFTVFHGGSISGNVVLHELLRNAADVIGNCKKRERLNALRKKRKEEVEEKESRVARK